MDISKADCEAAKASAIAAAQNEIDRINNEITRLEEVQRQLEAEIKMCGQVIDMLTEDQTTMNAIKSECLTKAKDGANLLTETANSSKNNFMQGAYYAGQDSGNSNDYKKMESVGKDFTDTKIPGMEKAVNDALAKLSKDLDNVNKQKERKEQELEEVKRQIEELKAALEQARAALDAANSIVCPDDPPPQEEEEEEEEKPRY